MVAGALVTLLVTGQVVLFVLPAGDPPAPADAVVVLAGPGQRLERGEELVAQGWADTLVIATETPDSCGTDGGYEQLCFRPDPATTRGEARTAAELARAEGWDHLLLVTQNEQALRARLRVARCVDDTVSVDVVTVRASLAESIYRVFYETGALAKALVLEPGC